MHPFVLGWMLQSSKRVIRTAGSDKTKSYTMRAADTGSLKAPHVWLQTQLFVCKARGSASQVKELGIASPRVGQSTAERTVVAHNDVPGAAVVLEARLQPWDLHTSQCESRPCGLAAFQHRMCVRAKRPSSLSTTSENFCSMPAAARHHSTADVRLGLAGSSKQC